MTTLTDRLWYSHGRPLWPLYPLAWLYRIVAEGRRRKAWQVKDEPLPVPVVVVGNITAGGTGKSPLTAWLVSLLKEQGWRPVILSRGYGGRSNEYPLQVGPGTGAEVAGDEPVMLAQETGCPVVVDPQRKRGALWALEHQLGDVLICDDGLQHYRLPRDIELAVFDAERGIGNGAGIPVGPLREPLDRLSGVDFVVTNGGTLEELEHPAQFAMTLEPAELRNLKTGKTASLDCLREKHVHAVAGIGNPGRFFATLEALGARVSATAFADHHKFRAADLQVGDGDWLLMTAKDAVKCREFAPDNAWVLSVQAKLPETFAKAFLARVQECKDYLTINEPVRAHNG
ncbi:tetraacyldisaccharide 4'-kinase [Marinobacter lipolyticus SM19]|uniref:Tetraacyldisaccharide 4'-kinase n=1 Tax=Marinobacter lipolyticus SM19 TaxID=1318628 RepID=R8B2R1_9GAMM|nr:tetraacyldisaccharide 4'-kinase [Marinobacter lipolyticus]EON92819.1 tetraacyldisaccharide 4'-kinase [Marinobacter lipolyticus SM19]